MKVIVLDDLIRQTEDRKLPSNIIKLIYDEYHTLHEKEIAGDNSLLEYIRKNNNGRHMKGTENIFKYRLTRGDRILYTYAKFVPCLKNNNGDELVLLGYSNHEQQGYFARKINLDTEHEYKYVKEIVDALDEVGWNSLRNEGLTENDIYAIAELLQSDNYMREHSMYVMTEKEMLNLSPEEYEKQLTPEQNAVIDNLFDKPCPLLILGGAGTGKTVIEVHILNDFCISQPAKQAIYFTQSEKLLEKVEKVFKKINNNESNNYEFWDVNSFCIDYLGKNEKDRIGTYQFVKFINSNVILSNLCKENNLSEVDVWTEIRGTLKGAMAKEWTHTEKKDQDFFGNNVAALTRKGYFRREGTTKFVTLAGSVEETRQRIEADELERDEKDTLTKAVNYYSQFDYNIRTISEADYYALSDEESTLDQSKRKIVWQICEEYEKYLIKENKFDDNDLVRMMYEEAAINNNMPQFSCVIVDEVQDLTELQIFLMSTICTSGFIVFAGDANQNVNPTYFRESRLNELFYNKNSGIGLRTVHLTQNFRCQEKVVNLANKLSALRRDIIGRTEIASEQDEKSMRTGVEPFRLGYNDANIMQLVKKLSQYPRVAILVPDYDTKVKLMDFLDKSQENTLIFTVSEIKGMEFAYVVCFNLISKYSSIWSKILKDNSRHNTRYRYYFNLIYVGITRAEEQVCFIDERHLKPLEELLSLNYIKRFSDKDMNFDVIKVDSDAWQKSAEQLEKSNKYEEALNQYIKANAPEETLNACKGRYAMYRHDFEEAVRLFVLSGNMKLAKRAFESIDNQTGPASRLFYMIQQIENDDEIYDCEHGILSKLIDECYPEQKENNVILNMVSSIIENKLEHEALKLMDIMDSAERG